MNQQEDPRQQYAYGPIPPPPRKRRVWPWVLLGAVGAPLAVFVGCSVMVAGVASQITAPRTLVYEVLGSGTATVLYSQTGGMGTDSEADLPWKKEVTSDGLSWGSVTATLGMQGGEILCRISTPDGQLVAENRATGKFASASCNGSAPRK